MDVLMPQLGETVAEGTVANWHKQVGDRVEADEILLDVETDKVSMEIPAPAAGVLTEIRVQEGTTVDVGTVLAVIETAGAGASAGTTASAGAVETAGAGATSAEVSPAEASATADASAPTGASAPAGQPASAESSQTGAAAVPPADPSSAATPGPSDAPELGPAAGDSGATNPLRRDRSRRLSPAVRRLAAEHRINLHVVAGSGRDGRITRRDVTGFLARHGSQVHTAAAMGTAQPAERAAVSHVAPSPSPTLPRAETATPAATQPLPSGLQPFTRIRRLTAEHMVRSKATSPHVLQAVEVDFHRVDRVRQSMRENWRAKHSFSLTYLPFIASAVCRALREFPNANASVQGDALLLHEHVNLGIAVDLGPEGLVAPVIKSAEQLSVAQLAHAIHDLSQRARENRLKPDDLAGGTYTLSNSGSFGTLITAPIINQPQVAILSIDGVRKKPVVIEGADGDAIAIRPVGILAQSFDHRAIDGAYSAAFLGRVRKLIEGSDWSVDV